MARKTLSDIVSVEAPQEFHDLSEMRLEIALDTYSEQDEDTQKAIDNVAEVLTQYATGNIKVGKKTYAVEAEDVGFSLFWLAVEIVKDLSFMDFKVAEFAFPEGLCSSCGVTL